MEKLFSFELALQADGIQVHVAYHAELVAQAAFIGSQQHILRPAGTPNQDGLAVDAKQPAAIGSKFRGNLANSEFHALLIGLPALRGKAHGQPFEMRLAHLVGPPDSWVANMQRRKLLRSEDHGTVFMGHQLDRLFKSNSCHRAGNHAPDRAPRGVVQLGVHGQVRGTECVVAKVSNRHR